METCQPACEVADYGRSLSSSQIRTVNGEMGSKMVEFQISFRQLRETHVVQVVAMTFDSVSSSIGGAMGVCLGASLITLIELLLFLCQLCLKAFHWPKLNRVAPDGHDDSRFSDEQYQQRDGRLSGSVADHTQ